MLRKICEICRSFRLCHCRLRSLHNQLSSGYISVLLKWVNCALSIRKSESCHNSESNSRSQTGFLGHSSNIPLGFFTVHITICIYWKSLNFMKWDGKKTSKYRSIFKHFKREAKICIILLKSKRKKIDFGFLAILDLAKIKCRGQNVINTTPPNTPNR